jgi:two-component sensor histidine kinase
MVGSSDLVVPLGLKVGGALTNALKHAFPEGRAGRVRVELRADDGGTIRVLVEDDGGACPLSGEKAHSGCG